MHSPQRSTEPYPQLDRLLHPYPLLVHWSRWPGSPWCLQGWNGAVRRPCRCASREVCGSRGRSDFPRVDRGCGLYVLCLVSSLTGWPDLSLAGGGLAVSWLDRNSRMGSSNGSSFKQLQLVKTGPSSYCGPTGPYNPRKPARKAPQRVASNKEPATQLPALPFKNFVLEFPEADSGAGPGPGHRQGTLSSGPDPRKERGLPSTRRPPKGPQTEKTKWRESVWARLAT